MTWTNALKNEKEYRSHRETTRKIPIFIEYEVLSKSS